MKKYLVLVIVAVPIIIGLICWGMLSPSSMFTINAESDPELQSIQNTPLSLASLPAAGYLLLEPVDSPELDHLGLGGTSPVRDPPNSPFNKYGMYWSQKFSLVDGDALQLTVYSNTPISWFGVDWSSLDTRGALATAEGDEDGLNFDPQYPSYSSIDEGPNGYRLTVGYQIRNDEDCVIVIKNNSSVNSSRLSVAASLKPNISVKRILKSIPVIKNFETSDNSNDDD